MMNYFRPVRPPARDYNCPVNGLLRGAVIDQSVRPVDYTLELHAYGLPDLEMSLMACMATL